MPLHLLGKKSWNVYNKSNIERVRRDEVDAERREKERERDEGWRRLAVLRGEIPLHLPDTVDEGGETRDDGGKAAKRRREDDDRHERRKMRRIKGEDDTARDIRLAGDDVASHRRHRQSERDGARKADDTPIVDGDGHIQLFTEAAHPPTAKSKQEGGQGDEQGMRFQDAAGYNAPSKPWYTASHNDAAAQSAAQLSGVEEKNVWGNPDPLRKTREQARISSSDPFAAMQSAQRQLKQASVDRDKWKREQEKEAKELEREKKRKRDTWRRREDDELENFSLDDVGHRSEEKERHRRRRHRSRSRERSRRHDKHRSRSQERRCDYSKRH